MERMTIDIRAVFYSKYILEWIGDGGTVKSFVWITDEGIYLALSRATNCRMSDEEYSSDERIVLEFKNQRAEETH